MIVKTEYCFVNISNCKSFLFESDERELKLVVDYMGHKSEVSYDVLPFEHMKDDHRTQGEILEILDALAVSAGRELSKNIQMGDNFFDLTAYCRETLAILKRNTKSSQTDSVPHVRISYADTD